MESIFIAIPSLDDSELTPTVMNAIESAEHPDRIFIGISLLSIDKKILKRFLKDTRKYSSQISIVYDKVSKKNVSKLIVGYGRKTATNLYSGQDYFLQVDAHTLFSTNWDSRIIELYKKAKDHVNNTKVVITAYAGSYLYDNDGKRSVGPVVDTKPSGPKPKFPRFMERSFYLDTIPKWSAFKDHEIDFLNKTFVPAIKFNANFAFSSGSFANESGLFENAEFMDEELIQTLNLISLGYTLVHPAIDNHIVCHLYGDDINEYGGYRRSQKDYPFLDEDLKRNKTINNFLEYIKDPSNKEVVEIYQKYANINLRLGAYKSTKTFPEQYLNSKEIA